MNFFRSLNVHGCYFFFFFTSVFYLFIFLNWMSFGIKLIIIETYCLIIVFMLKVVSEEEVV